ncbi:CbiQ family ECF transporter T component [Halorarum salinum]|uniref:Energy-coupling factor transporter transmembrane protein EcfT n=1 Tax=Halorarum salinum TaxID=2743089 RepID=A0A7D5QCB9_9EURY|nr:CbiQ family ECF transporter T component [Halobaculum salinum]QLG62540.1 energy-coupling factor transporter transmembrane protein EcfT [Halobaculum salinum]
MLRYAPGDTLAHRLDPRTKLTAQAAFVTVAFAHTTPVGLLALTAVALGLLALAGLGPRVALGEVRGVVPFLLVGPVVEAARFGPPWLVPADAVAPALASYRTVLLLLLAVAYVRTTPVRDSEAAVARLVPGRPGRLAAIGVGLVFRFLPLLQADVARARTAMRARLGTERPVAERVRLVATAGLGHALGRADALALALRARCVSWNPTPPPLEFGRADAAGLAFSAGLLAWGLLP